MTVTSTRRWSVLGLGLCAAALLMGVSLASAFADDAPANPALKTLSGTWETSESDNVEAKWVFKDEKVEVAVNGQDYVGKIKADDKAKPHSTLDIELTDGPDDAKGKTAKAIYKIDGDKLVICVSMPGRDRPKEFETVPEESHLFELKKQKKE